MKAKRWINLPNLLTMSRIVLAAALLVVFLRSEDARKLAPLCLILAAGVTDALDGFFARRMDQVTDLGKVLDPIADKLMCASAVLCLCLNHVISWFILAVIVVKEIYMGVGAGICLHCRLEVASDIYGKSATALFYPAVFLVWPWHENAALYNIGRVMLVVSVALSIAAAVHYTLDSVKKWRAKKAR